MKIKNYKGTYAYQCDIGRVRKSNEDRVKGMVNSFNNVLLVVADGMGGHKKGEYASNEVVSFLSKEFNRKGRFTSFFDAHFWLCSTVKKINKNIFNLQDNDENYRGMGSTICVALIYKRRLMVLNAGDSRCYILKNNKLEQITEDQTYVRYLINSGQINEKEALTHPKRHYLTNAIGLFPTFSYDLFIYDYHGESLFLCSDGLYNNVSFSDIEANLRSNNSVDDKINSLVNLANYNGGSDNISCILWESLDDQNQ